uniref:Membrane magnesium transporter n=1 Tax=Romanomermis culicivorax TaxID=13658 RepID=A0A915ISV4_ROMCU
MTASSATKFLLAVGAISLIHCGYSAAQHRSYLRLTEQEFLGLPADIFLQTLLSLFFICYFGAGVAGDFQQIRADLTMRQRYFEHAANCPSFYTFDHRAKSLSPFFTTASSGGRLSHDLDAGNDDVSDSGEGSYDSED